MHVVMGGCKQFIIIRTILDIRREPPRCVLVRDFARRVVDQKFRGPGGFIRGEVLVLDMGDSTPLRPGCSTWAPDAANGGGP